MWILYGLLTLLGLLTVLLSVPIFGRITYDGVLRVRIRVIGIPIILWPHSEPKEGNSRAIHRKQKRVEEEKPSTFQEWAALLKQDDVGATLHFLCEVADLASKTAGRLLRAITISRLDLAALIASDDPADTAKRYGQVCSVLYPALSAIETVTRIRQSNLRIEPNFLIEKSAVRFDIRLRMSVWRLLGAGIALLWGFLMIKEQSNPQINKEVS